ncbi:hypothetical protein IV79_GL000541 [Pediococcus claussenii]|nr:hypothetical protein IV79_GL000541 [Pediococcus claussenii]
MQFRSKNDGSDERRLQPAISSTDYFFKEKTWFRNVPKEVWHLISEDGIKLQATFINHNSTKTAILAHGYRQDGDQNGKVAALFYNMEYNILMPDDRGHGNSHGRYIGFGWQDRKDYLSWITQVINQLGSNQSIILWGVSMGGATVLMTSGDLNLPTQVKGVIADCGFTSLEAELKFQFSLRQIPSFPVLNIASFLSKVLIGYSYPEASSMTQLSNNKLPILFIHGAKDKFVPFSMLNEVINSNAGTSQWLVVSNATHANAFRTDPIAYTSAVRKFLFNINMLK